MILSDTAILQAKLRTEQTELKRMEAAYSNLRPDTSVDELLGAGFDIDAGGSSKFETDSGYLHPLEVAIGLGLYVATIFLLSHLMGPFHVVAPSSTVDHATARGADIPIEQRDPTEITARFAARNPAFDVTPAGLITAIVTEHGVHEAPYGESLVRAVVEA